MTPQTMYAISNEAYLDFDEFTLEQALEYVEFEEEIQSWEFTDEA